MSILMPILVAIGAMGISCFLTNIFEFFKFIYPHFLRRSSITRYKYDHPNSSASPWAIITGSTDGIGLAYAHELAILGFNIVLHGRNATKLHHVRQDLQKEYPHLEFRILILDAAESGARAMRDLYVAVEALRELHVTVLINNVGTGGKNDGPMAQSFVKTTEEDLDLLINVNARFPMQFTHAVLPLLLSHGGPALIMNMGSIAEFGIPYLTPYSCLKSSNLAFSRALRREMMAEGRGNVEVLGIMLAGVTGTSWDKSKGDMFRPRTREFARSALGVVGCGLDVVAPWWTHDLVWKMVRSCPAWLLDSMLVGLSRMMLENPDYTKII